MFSNLKLATKIILVASTVLVLAFGSFALNNYLLLKNQTEQDLNKVLGEISSSVSENIANWLNGKLNIVASISAAAEGKTDEQIFDIVVQAAQAGLFKNAYVGTESGKFILDDAALQASLPADYDPRQRPWYTQTKTDKVNSFTEPYIDVTTDALTISAISPVLNQGVLEGVSGGDINMSAIAEIVNKIDFMGLGYAFLVTGDGKVLIHPQKQYVDQPAQKLLGRTALLNSGLTDYDVNGEEKLVSFKKVDGIESVDWYLGLVVDKDKAYESITGFRDRALIHSLLGILTIVVLLNFVFKFLMGPLQELMGALKDISQGEGDLTQRLDVKTEDEFGQLSIYFNQFIDQIHRSISEVNKETSNLHKIVADVTVATQSALDMSVEQNEKSNGVSAAIQELSAASDEIATNASNASELARKANDLSVESQSAISENLDSINGLANIMEASGKEVNELNSNTANIGKILDVIKSVSEQTNLLALNAAIEAARAGEAGRGFAVVADEVRQLAQRTQESTQEIETMMASLQTGSNSVVNSMSECKSNSDVSVSTATLANDKVSGVINAIQEMDSANHSVAAATEEQTAVIRGVDSDIKILSELTEEESASLEKTIIACEQLKASFAQLDVMVSQFKI